MRDLWGSLCLVVCVGSAVVLVVVAGGLSAFLPFNVANLRMRFPGFHVCFVQMLRLPSEKSGLGASIASPIGD